MSGQRSREQKLIDIMFQAVEMVTRPEYVQHFQDIGREKRMEWVAHQLRECGFDTVPMGSSWGALKS